MSFWISKWIGSMMCNLLQKDNISILKPNIRANDIEKVENFINDKSTERSNDIYFEEQMFFIEKKIH